jgi:hypothetical protein
MDTRTTALILVGFQNDAFAPYGILRGMLPDQDRIDTALTNTVELIRRVESTDMLIVSTPIVLARDYRVLAESDGILSSIRDSGAFREGRRGAESVPELLAFGDRIVYVPGRQGFNCFADTNLETVLRRRRVHHVMIAGMLTSLCVDSTSRTAYERGYKVSVLSDCTVSRTQEEQDFYCRVVLPLYADVVQSSAVVEQLDEVSSWCAV